MKTEKAIHGESFRRADSSPSFGVADFGDVDEQQNIAISGSKEFRCRICSRLLAKKNRNGVIAGEIKCPRCGTISEI